MVPKGWDKLYVSLLSTETGKTVSKSGKASVQNGMCRWTKTLSESVWISQDEAPKEFEQYLFKLVVSMGSARSSILGEATINLAGYMSSRASIPVSLPLKKCNHGTILQVMEVEIQCLTPRTKSRVITKETPNLLSRNTPIDEFPAALQGLYDTVFDVDNDKERAEAQGLEPNGFSFDGADAVGVDYAINREKNCRKGRFSPSKLKGKRVIELGAGCGVAGFGMALLGCDVVSTDQTEVLPLLMRNCERNASRIMQMNLGSDSFGSIQVAELSWGNVDQIKAVDPPFDYIIGTDVVYAEHLLEPLLQTMLALSGPKTTILVQYLSSSSSSNGGQIGATTEGNHLSMSMRNNQQRPFINPPQLFATAAASSGFPQQITTRPQNWLHQKN
ncbi:unnamed protein product [Camellia sinensis]